MPKSERQMIQIRLTAAEKQRIKSLAAARGMTLQKAVVVAFAAWAEKPRDAGSNHSRNQAPTSDLSVTENSQKLPDRTAWEWRARAIQLNWSQCPEVELLEDETHRLWALRGADAPLNEVLRAVADGLPLPKIAEVFDLELSQLEKVIEFAQ